MVVDSKFILDSNHKAIHYHQLQNNEREYFELCAKYEFASSDTTRSTFATDAYFVWAL
jgi:hypothetical protein